MGQNCGKRVSEFFEDARRGKIPEMPEDFRFPTEKEKTRQEWQYRFVAIDVKNIKRLEQVTPMKKIQKK
jgi:hypothetical protein